MQAELQGGRAALRNLGSKQYRLDEEHLKQQEILYTQVGHHAVSIVLRHFEQQNEMRYIRVNTH